MSYLALGYTTAITILGLFLAISLIQLRRP
jgi:hypothetical protein